jgi:hypothetical protein
MWTVILIPAACWLCAVIAVPRKPCVGNEVEELVYARLLGRERQLVLLACVVTVVTLLVLVLSLPRRIDPTLDAVRHPPQVCADHLVGVPTCYTRQPDGTWVEEAMQDDGSWRQVSVARPPADEGAGPFP